MSEKDLRPLAPQHVALNVALNVATYSGAKL